MGSSVGTRISLGGTAVVCCIHDREKRRVTTEADVAALGLSLTPPVVYDPVQHKLHRCACCENLFVDPSDEPRYCASCLRPNVHAAGGPLPEPIGVVG